MLRSAQSVIVHYAGRRQSVTNHIESMKFDEAYCYLLMQRDIALLAILHIKCLSSNV